MCIAMYYFLAFRSCVVAGEPACTSWREKPRVVSFRTFLTWSTYSTWLSSMSDGYWTCDVLDVRAVRVESNESNDACDAFGMPLGRIDVLYDYWTILNLELDCFRMRQEVKASRPSTGVGGASEYAIFGEQRLLFLGLKKIGVRDRSDDTESLANQMSFQSFEKSWRQRLKQCLKIV